MQHRVFSVILALALTNAVKVQPDMISVSDRQNLFAVPEAFLEVNAENDEEPDVPEEITDEASEETPAGEEEVVEPDPDETPQEPAADANQPKTDVVENPGSEPVFAAAASAQIPDNGIPVVIIEIDESEGHTIDEMNASNDHSVECYGTIQIIVPEGFTYCDTDISPASFGPVKLDYIRGRGNSTWTFEKKPYKFKLNKKADLFGLGKNKHWVLLANTLDPTGFKNRLSGYLGNELDLAYTPNGFPVDVVMVAKKDGMEYNRIYLGNYLLAEQVRVDENRLEIGELSADDVDPQDITGGYLVQFGQQVEEGSPDKFYTEHGINLANDTPTFDPDDSDYTNETQKEYIRGYIQTMEDALFGKDVDEGDPFTNTDGVRYNEYMDMESAAKYWLIQEASGNADMFKTGSTYFYKIEDQYDSAGSLMETGKVFWGPLWDFDQGWGKPGMPAMNTSGFHLRNEWLLAMAYDDDPEGFRETAKRIWPDIRDTVLSTLEDGGLIDQYYEETLASMQRDYEIWKDIVPSYHVAGDFYQNKEDVKTYIRARVAWLDNHILGSRSQSYPGIDGVSHRVTYVADGHIIRREYYGTYGSCEVYTPDGVNENVFIPAKEGYVFIGWKDENGAKVTSPQDIYTDLTFYADFVSEEEAIEAEKIVFRSEEERCSLLEVSFASLYTVLPYDAQVRNIVWTSSDPDTASVDQHGTVSLHKAGTVTITAALQSGAASSYQLNILNDYEAAVEDVELAADHMELEPGEYSHIDYRIIPENACMYSVKFRSEDNTVASVDKNGVVTAMKPGTAQITLAVTYNDENFYAHTIEKTCTVTVKEQETAVLTYKLGGGTYNGSTADIEETHAVGDVIKVHAAPSRDGYTFRYWQGSEYQPGDDYTVTADHTFTAVWQENKSEDKSSGSVPPTGDSSDTAGWLIILLAAGAAAVWASLQCWKSEA